MNLVSLVVCVWLFGAFDDLWLRDGLMCCQVLVYCLFSSLGVFVVSSLVRPVLVLLVQCRRDRCISLLFKMNGKTPALGFKRKIIQRERAPTRERLRPIPRILPREKETMRK